MRAAELRDEIVTDCLALAWDQWSQLGVSAAAPREREERAADPEALLLFTLEVARNDPRLFDEVLDWLALNEPLLSIQRLRNLCATDMDAALVAGALEWSAGVRGRARQISVATPALTLAPLFHSLPMRSGPLDESFARHGVARTPLKRSGKSQPPRLRDPIGFGLRLRRLLGVGVRAEVIRTLLTIRAPRLSGRVITASAAFAQRNVREGLTHLLEAGIIDVVEIADDRQYSIQHAAWAILLALPAAPDLPFHYDWIPVLRALTTIVRWLQQDGLDDLTPYLLSSRARTLVEEVAADLSRAGVSLGLYSALGIDFWDQFTEITRSVIRHARNIQ